MDVINDNQAGNGGGGGGDELTPLALLLDELKSDDVHLRLASIRRLSTIALALGPQRTRAELVPFLQDQLDDEDEVLLSLAEELGEFTDYVGGKEWAYTVLGALENLAAVEEVIVRSKASESVNKIVSVMPSSQVDDHFMPMLRRLSTGDWFTSRTSACDLYATAYPKSSPESQKEMRKLFADLCNDDTPMVRRAAAKALGPLAKTFTSQHQLLLSEIVPLYKKLAADDQDSVRLLTIPDLIAIAEQLSPAELKAELAVQTNASYTDKSWRVRYMLADHFVELATAVGPDMVREEMVKAFVELLGDNEAEVRTAAAGQVPGEQHRGEDTTRWRHYIALLILYPSATLCRLRQTRRQRRHPCPHLAMRSYDDQRCISTRPFRVGQADHGSRTVDGQAGYQGTPPPLVFAVAQGRIFRGSPSFDR